MNRRDFIQTGALAGAGAMVLSQTSCAPPKNLDLYIEIVVGTLGDVAPLLPGAAQLIAKGISIANDIKSAYKAGKFQDGTALLANLADVIDRIIADAGVNTPRIKIILALAKTAMRAIALILRAAAPAAALAKAKAGMSTMEAAQMTKVEALTDSAAIDRIFAAAR